MKEEAIKFKTANLAEKKGYPFEYLTTEELGKVPLNIPTQSLLQRWLREKHDIVLTIAYPVSIEEYTYDIRPYFEAVGRFYFNTYEEALEKGLQEALRLI